MLTKLSRSIVVWATHALTRRPSAPVPRAPLALVAAPRHSAETHLIPDTSAQRPPREAPPSLRLVWSEGAPVGDRDILITGVDLGLPAPAGQPQAPSNASPFLAGQGARLYSLEAFRRAIPGRTPHAA